MSDANKLPTNAFPQRTVAAVGYTAIAVVTVVLIARISLHFYRPKKLATEDYLVFVAYIFFIVQCSLYIAIAPLSDRVLGVQEGRIPYYEGLLDDGLMLGRLYNPALMVFWIILWSVKFSLLFLYRKLLVGLPIVCYRLWWVIVAFCIVTQIGNFVAYFMSCETVKGMFDGGCHDIVRQFASLWYSYAADTTTNIMSTLLSSQNVHSSNHVFVVIAFPLHLTWNVRMPRAQKLAINALFTSGVVCIFIATLRAAQITANTIKTKAPTDGTWLALWGMVECAIGWPLCPGTVSELADFNLAVIIGCCPSFAVLINAKRKSYKKPSYNTGVYDEHPENVKLRTIGSQTTRIKTARLRSEITDSLWIDDHSSQEELATSHSGINISTGMQEHKA
ncbi:hypothetical protein OPT61_g3714 [Boeremia exigua]|uniref:Uncharacterized protein n=1 Tax=Boeremia exigua TaxID=749465 RepID=A0ACC2IGV8_9PLEO|nr:hypothetical protein OPT61_g3714 [Boeremia exigua]